MQETAPNVASIPAFQEVLRRPADMANSRTDISEEEFATRNNIPKFKKERDPVLVRELDYTRDLPQWGSKKAVICGRCRTRKWLCRR